MGKPLADISKAMRDIGRDANVGVTYTGNAGWLGIVGKSGIIIHVDSTA
jgi:hypothetical protein